MKARRITIMLTIVAISALTLFLISVLDSDAMAAPAGWSLAAVPDTLPSYEETISIGPDGNSRVDIVIVIGQGGPGDLLLPFDFVDGDSHTVLSGPAAFAADLAGDIRPTIEVLGRRMLNLQRLADAAPGDTVHVTARVPGWFAPEEAHLPYGEFALARRYVNFSAFVLQDFRLNLLLPPGMVVHAIEKVVPAFDPKQNATPPFAVSRSGGRILATLAAQNLAPATAVQLDLAIRPARRGWIPLVAGIIAALLYLVFFRDVLKPKETE